MEDVIESPMSSCFSCRSQCHLIRMDFYLILFLEPMMLSLSCVQSPWRGMGGGHLSNLGPASLCDRSQLIRPRWLYPIQFARSDFFPWEIGIGIWCDSVGPQNLLELERHLPPLTKDAEKVDLQKKKPSLQGEKNETGIWEK